MSYWETFPSESYPIDFRLIEDLARDPKYYVYGHPVLERPRQKALDPDKLQLISRDYCILQSPGETSWQRKKTQEQFHMRIFHTDTVQIPPDGSFDGVEGTRLQIKSYNDHWYLRGMTRTYVEKIFTTHFNLTIPLSHETTADHWLPAYARYNVEVSENIWENRVALFFDGNIQTSLQSMKYRIKSYHQQLGQKLLGERYVELWKSRWATDEASQISSTVKSPIEPLAVEDVVELEAAVLAEDPQCRGRKRRAALRQIRAAPPDRQKNTVQKAAPKFALTVSVPEGSHVRGRLKRRERRKKIGEPKKLSDVKQTKEMGHSDLHKTYHAYRPRSKPDGERWSYDSGEIGVKERTNEIPAALILDIEPVDSHDLDSPAISSTSQETSELDSDQMTKVTNKIPIITIRSLEVPGRQVTTPKLFHLISFYREKIPDEEPEDEKVYRPPQYRDSSVHIANVIDEVGFVSTKKYDSQGFISVIDCNPGSLIPAVAAVQQSSADSFMAKERNVYWQKFAVLAAGFPPTAGDFVDLPYSQGYGVSHQNPNLIYRKNRWGYLDVDNVSRNSKRPRWRAAWRFEFWREGAELCDCRFGDVCHDLDRCRSMAKDNGNYGKPFENLRDEVLSDVLLFSHKPYEFLEGIEGHLHKYWPPYIRPDDEKTEEERARDKAKAIEEVDAAVKIVEMMREMSPDASDPVRDIELQNIATAGETLKAAERTFEMGVCHLMGLGVPKGIEQGIKLLVTAAKHGSERGQALSSALSASYGVDTKITVGILQKWLFHAATHGSGVAIREIQGRYPEKYELALAVNQYAGDPRHPEVLNYLDHILPHFNLEDVKTLSEQIQSTLLKIKDERLGDTNPTHPTQQQDIYAMIAKPDSNDPQRPSYFVFGSLLHLASLFGFIDAVSLLLDAGYDIDAHGSHPSLRTPLLCALSRGHAAVAKLLINRGAACEPLIMWAQEEKCLTPSPLHYLVNVDNEIEMKELARLMVKKGADFNCKCSVYNFQWQMPSGVPTIRGSSVTPLRWAVLNEKPKVVKALLGLGAKFAYIEYLTRSMNEDSTKSEGQKGCLLLETPCTDPDILEMFFARARVPGLPSDFQATPLGLLISEDDGPERRLRPGFEDPEKTIDAVRLLLDLQPGYEDVLLWSAVRHDHLDVVRFLLEDLGWSIETRWKGLTLLHTAVLYGRLEIVRYLIDERADAIAVTENRHLTCIHLIMLYPRDPDTDQDLLGALSSCEIDLNAKETIDGLTALHVAVRNRKFPVTKELIRLGSDICIPVTDQLQLLSSGRNGYLKSVAGRPKIFSDNLIILGEAIVQYLQDDYYTTDYVADLLVLFLDANPGKLSTADLIIDKGNEMTLLHLLATAREPDLAGKVIDRDYFQQRDKPKSPPDYTAKINLLQLVLSRVPTDFVNIQDAHGDTPLHYACAVHELHNIRTLLAWGADPSIRNGFGFNAVELLAWSCIYLRSKTFKFGYATNPWNQNLEGIPTALAKEPLPTPLHSVSDLYQAFEIFEELGHTVDPRLRQLALAWDNSKTRDTDTYFSAYSTEARSHLRFVPEEVARVDENENERNGEIKPRRKYIISAVAGPQRVDENTNEERWEARTRDEERGAL